MSRALIFNLAAFVSSSSLLEDDSVNLLQTTVHRHGDSGKKTVEDKKACVVKGDPHIKLWDTPPGEGAKMGLYGTYADYWLVHTNELKVMGRISGVSAFDMGVVKGIAVSGSLVGDKILEVPSTNNGPITFDGVPIDAYPWEGGGLKITKGRGPNLNLYGSARAGELRDNTYTVTMDKAVISFNQAVFQHLEIEVDPSLATADTGLCSHECTNWFDCQDPICNLDVSLFSTEHPRCGEEINRVPCNKLRKKLATTDCLARFSGDPPNGMAVQNCIEDCCADRDQCPDRGKGDGLATCLIFGDPHIKGWDAQGPSQSSYNPMGTHWLVHSQYLKVQGIYETNKKIKAQMQGIAITGPLVGDALDGGGHPVLFFRGMALGGGVFVVGDDKMLIPCKYQGGCKSGTNFYADPAGHYNITFGYGPDITQLLTDKRPVAFRSNMYTIEFALGAKFQVHQGDGQNIYMSLDADMLEDVTGECGNNNGDPTDDHHDREDSSALCAVGNEIFVPGGQDCKVVDQSLFKCTHNSELNPFKDQCMKHFKYTVKPTKHTEEAALLRDCQKDCCFGGTCPGNGVSDEAM